MVILFRPGLYKDPILIVPPRPDNATRRAVRGLVQVTVMSVRSVVCI